MTLWVTNTLEADLVINTDILREKAEFFARSFEVNNFKAFNGWISNFKKRHNMKEYDYDLNDVFNCDETGLYWDLEPSKTLAREIINSFKAKYRKLLVKNRVEAYEISQQLNKGADSLNIHDAIVFCTNAWNAVTQEIIYNCWKHTGILPLVNQEKVNESVNQLGEDNQVEREEIQFLIDQLPFDDHMNADEFIHIDDHLKSNKGLTDKEIISLVNLDKNELEVESDEEIPSVISKVQTLNDLDDLVMFFKYSSLNNSINQSKLNTLQKLRHEVLRSHITDLKQATLDSYFTSNPNNVII
ncbi:unnamed protein product [Rhizophagus irregularis]|nr:unnamed protein product [Rhizophagus irregularis]